MLEKLNGFVAETMVQKAVKGKIKAFELPSNDKLIEIANQSQIGRNRLQSAKPYLEKEFGFYYRNPKTYQMAWHFDWRNVPPKIILDHVYGIDISINFFGYAIAIDVTVNPDELLNKQHKLQNLQPLWQTLGYDKAVVLLVKNPCFDLASVLKSVLKLQEKVVIAEC